MPWAIAASVAAPVIMGALSGRSSKKAAGQAAAGQQASVDEQRRQFDITQKQQEPWRQAGEDALGRYENQLGQRQGYEDQIRSNVPGQFQYGGQVPGSYQSPTDVPQAYSGQSGNYFGNIQNNVQPGFQFGRQEFEQYKDPGYDFRREEGLRALERSNAAGGRRNSGYNTRSLMELGQNLGSQEFGAARGRAMQDYQSGVNREEQTYGRSVGDFNRRVGREGELYGRGRQQRLDETGREATQYGRGRQLTLDEQRREQEQYGRGLRDYGLGVEREQAQYGRDISRYGRQYLDPMGRDAALAGMGQNTATNLGSQRGAYAQNVGGLMQNIGGYNASGTLGEAGAYAGAIGSLGNLDWNGMDGGSVYDNPMQQTPQYLARYG